MSIGEYDMDKEVSNNEGGNSNIPPGANQREFMEKYDIPPGAYNLDIPSNWREFMEKYEAMKSGNARLLTALSGVERSVSQILGKALGYPWYKDDQRNFPGATESDGVCTADHTAISLAMEAAERLNDLNEACRLYVPDCEVMEQREKAAAAEAEAEAAKVTVEHKQLKADYLAAMTAVKNMSLAFSAAGIHTAETDNALREASEALDTYLKKYAPTIPIGITLFECTEDSEMIHKYIFLSKHVDAIVTLHFVDRVLTGKIVSVGIKYVRVQINADPRDVVVLDWRLLRKVTA